MPLWRKQKTASPSSVTGRWLLAMVNADREGMARYRHDPDEDNGEGVAFRTFRLTVRKVFDGGPDDPRIAGVVASLKKYLPDARVPQDAGERLIRQALGADVAVDDLSWDERLNYSMLLTGAAVWDTRMPDSEFVALVVAAENG